MLCLVSLGALVTSWHAGMAVPDWPLSFGSLNPEGWWSNFGVRLEHGHRLLAASVGVLVAVLACKVWGTWAPLLWAVIVSSGVHFLGRVIGFSPSTLAHLGIWPSALVFIGVLLVKRPGFNEDSQNHPGPMERWLALMAFCLVSVQATLGGLRVTRETAGALDVALVLRVMHGCVAQGFLCVLVILAVRLGGRGVGQAASWGSNNRHGLPLMLWGAVMALFLQLVIGATMRHLGVGLVIPTFPSASPDGGWLPGVSSPLVWLNFLHTRIGALGVSVMVIWGAVRCLKYAWLDRALRGGAIRSLGLVCVQVSLGILVIWDRRPPGIATLHVVVGACLLANLVACASYVSFRDIRTA